MKKHCVIKLFAMLLLAATFIEVLCGFRLPPEACKADWPDWNRFKKTFINEGGRVIDLGSQNHHTTSEGQAYALFFALAANDADSFKLILQWTENNLAQGDLTAHLPAWEWGKRNDDSWGVLDDNSAADADLWLAYTLGEAGRLWSNQRYASLSVLIANRIAREETADIPELGASLLPGRAGFHPDENTWRLNPSYLPLPLLKRFAVALPQSRWPELLATSRRILLQTSRGFSPDWLLFRTHEGFAPDKQTAGIGGYDAIRVYLWGGLMPASDPFRIQLLEKLAGMKQYTETHGVPPERVDTATGVAENTGPAGFSAALLGFLQASGAPNAVTEQKHRIAALPFAENSNAYYDQALSLFGLGGYEQRFQFADDGSLTTVWSKTKACKTP
ncbi:cellulose synthase complex periplasmic endoglucanase BcsZ [Candidatus Methylospira mobilis]|nr:cellulose synthase complex periplasmic endoglucanase BcsZ [Candidatus Methylospira mobilis]WNV03188.1 cellulose synthase complex periplasmic endoglucanase BcsZ [Candidatus Methylospira mobilis]